MPQPARCRHCFHAAHSLAGDCGADGCGCVRYEPVDLEARERRKRLWLAEVAFFVKNRWTKIDVRVRAQGQGGALFNAVRQAKKLALKPYTRVAQLRVTLTPVPGTRQK